MRVGARSDAGRVRSSNEDRYGVLPNLLVVADGMGGVQAGEVASQLLVDTLVGYPFGAGEAAEELVAAVQLANRQVYAAAQGRSEWHGMGTTVTAALLREDHCYVAQIGDSRAYLIRDGSIRRLTEDHSLVGELYRSGKISAEEAMSHPQRNILTRALGTAPEVRVDVVEERIGLDDVLVLCTDGLTSLVPDAELFAEVMRHADPQQAADGLIDLANARGGRDNITVIVAHLLPPALGAEPELRDQVSLEDVFEMESVFSR